MIKVGITGQAGFVGTNLYNYLKEDSRFDTIPFEDGYYEDTKQFKDFTSKCDVIVHLAAIMRSQEPGIVYDTNMRLVRDLINAADNAGARPTILFSSSIQETGDSEYARCKREGAELLGNWCAQNGKGFCKMIFPNLFGPFAKPNYSSFIATFCYKLTHGEDPQVLVDNEVPLAYIGDVVNNIADLIVQIDLDKIRSTYKVEPQFRMKVTEALLLLKRFKVEYYDCGKMPTLKSKAEKDLFTTFCSYIER